MLRLYGIAQCQKANFARNNRGMLIEPDDSAYEDDEVLDCGKPVNFTYYDHLVGIQNRASHLHIPEPDVAAVFKKKGSKKKHKRRKKYFPVNYSIFFLV